MVTRLFLHSATSSVSGTLPSAEQSTLTSANDFEANQATNRSMSKTIGVSETSLANTSTATTSQVIYYCGRWVSDPLNQSGIAANTWSYGFGTSTNNVSANFPSRANQSDVHVNIYVWRPTGGGSLVGTIVDGVTSQTSNNTNNHAEWLRTVTGSAVAGAAVGDVIVFEAWFKITQASATAYTQTFYFDGTVIPTTNNGTVTSSAASFISTPENILFNSEVNVKLYLHATTSGLPSGTLPSAEQSTNTVTSACNFEGSQTTNRLMDSTIGVSQATLSLTGPASGGSYTFYVSRWVSPVIYQTQVDAGTWTYNFAARESGTAGNFPVTSSNKAVWVNCYVWKPSDGTKYGTILDGNTGATVTEGAGATERSQQADFTGAAVSSLTSGDACIVFEVWFVVAPTGGFIANDFFYDGTIETAGGSTVSDHASYIMTQGMNLTFTAGGTLFDRPLSTETISVSESLAEIYNANRAPTAETISIGESQVRLLAASRALSAETITISESLARVFGVVRTQTAETVTISEALARLLGANRTLSDTTAISEAIAKVQTLVRSLSDTTAISESLTKILTLVRNISAETVTIGESIVRVFVGIRALSDTSAISESLTKVQVLVRSLSDTTAISELLARILGINRSLSDTTTISESLSRLLGLTRSLIDTTIITETITRVFGAVRLLSDTTTISESLARLIAIVRSLSDTIIESGTVATVYTSGAVGNFVRSLSDITAISENLARSITNARSLIETTVIGESLNRILGVVRSLLDTTIISESLSRLAGLTRSLSDTTIISESLTKIYEAIRNISDTTTVSESLNRILGLTRSLSDITIISEILSRVQGLTRTLIDIPIVISESLTRAYGILKSLSDTVTISESISRLTNMVRNLTEFVIILESLVRTIIGIITDYVPSLVTDFKDDIDKMVLPYIFSKWNATGQLQKGSNMIDANFPIEFKVGIHSSRPYQVLALEQQTEINKISINKFSGGMWRFSTMVEVTVMVQRLQRDIPIELSQMEKEIQRIVCHYTRDEIVGIDDLSLVGMRREWMGNNTDWSKSIWSTKIYLKAEYQKVNTENY